jgi:hypothetical protein
MSQWKKGETGFLPNRIKLAIEAEVAQREA